MTSIARQSARNSERLVAFALFLCAAVTVLVTLGIVLALAADALAFFRHVNPLRFLTGTHWAPLGGRIEAGDFGVLPLLAGTAAIGLGALLVGVPLGLATAVYLSEYAPGWVRSILKPTLELLAGIPTVVIGFFALQFVTPSLLRSVFGADRVFIFNAAAGAIGVGLMILPLVASISEDAMRAVPMAHREAAFGLGASRRSVALRVVIPGALSGIVAAMLLGLSRAVGETMVVTIAAGNTPDITPTPFESVQTITASIAQTLGGEVAAGTVRYQSLFALGATLFVLTLLMNVASNRFVRRFRQVESH